MNAQTDFFAAGEVRSIPPQYDPTIVGAVHTRVQVDRDHVGENEVGKFGNNAAVYVVEVWDKDGEIIWAQKCDSEAHADRLSADILRRLEANRQTDLFA